MCVPIVGSPAFSFWRRRLGRMVSFPLTIGARTASVVRSGHARNLGGALRPLRFHQEPFSRFLFCDHKENSVPDDRATLIPGPVAEAEVIDADTVKSGAHRRGRR